MDQKDNQDKLEAEAEGELETIEKARYTNFEFNQALLAEAFGKLVKTSRRKPTIRQLMEETGLSWNTVRNHLKTLEKTEISEKWASFRILTEHVILAQAKNAIAGGKGSAQSAKLFLELIEGWSPGMKLEITGNINHTNMSNEELLAKYEENAKLIDGKLLRFIRNDSSPGRTGSDFS